VQPGVIYLASRTGMRIVPLGVGHRRPWRVKSWDSFAIPRPFSRVRCLCGLPITVPPDLPPDALGPHAERLQAELAGVTGAAQTWADTGRFELPPPIPQTRVPAAALQQPPQAAEVVGVGRGGG
jgi:hypothetical protein